MFGLTTWELRLAVAGALAAAFFGWLAYHDHKEIAKGEARRDAQIAAAVSAQKAEDEKTSAGVVNDLKAKLAAIPAASPPPVLRLCPSPTRSMRTSPVTSGAQPPVAGTTGTGPSGVSTGDLGLDVGPQLQDSKRAAQVLAIYADETRDWALKQSK